MSLLRNLFQRSNKPSSLVRRRRLFLEPLEARQLLTVDLMTTKTADPSPVVAGTELTYTIRLVNRGPNSSGGPADEPAENVVLTDAIPDGTEFVSFTAPDGWAENEPLPDDPNPVVTATIASLPVDVEQVFTLVVRVDPGRTAPITNLAGAETSTMSEANPADDEGEVTTNVIQRFDLAVLSKTDTPDPVQAAANITYTIDIINNGPSDVPAVLLTDLMPLNTTYVSLVGPPEFLISPPGTPTGTASAVGPLDAGETATFTLIVRVNDGTPGNTTITNTAEVFVDPADPNPGNNSGTTTTTVEGLPVADLVVTKVDSPDPVSAGGNITYTITLQNTGTVAATDVELTDGIPLNTTFVSFTQLSGPTFLILAPSAGSGPGNDVIAQIASFPGGTATFEMIVRVNPATTQGTTISNTASVTTETTEPSTTNNSDEEQTSVNVRANLGVTKLDNPDPVIAGNNLTYNINVTTAGPSDAQTVVFTDDIPANTSLVSVGFPAGWTRIDTLQPGATTGTIRFERTSGTLPAGTPPSQFQIVVRVNPDATGAINNTANVSAATVDPAMGNNTALQTTTVQVLGDLSVTKVDTQDPVVAGSNITYTITVTNAGPSTATTVALTDDIPANTTFVSFQQTTGPTFTVVTPTAGASTGTSTATIASLPPGATATFTYVVRVNPGTPNGTTITNVANVSSPSDTTLANNQDSEDTSVQPPPAPDVVVTKVDVPDPVVAGNNVIYTITVRNAGSGAAGTVNLTDTVPANTTFVSMNQTAGPTFTITRPPVGSTGTTVSATAASLAPAATATFELTVRVNPGAAVLSISNTASATTAGDSNTANNSDTEATVVQSQADVTVSKTDSPDPVGAGGTITYTINVNNPGPSNGQTVRLSDAIPTNTTFVSFAAPAGWNVTTPAPGGTGTVTATFGSLPPGLATFTLLVRVNNNVLSGTTITNTASVTATNDPNASNNSAIETTTVVVPPDFGDAPTSYGTLLANNGPRHSVSPLRLGALVDSEGDGLAERGGRRR